MPDRPGTGGPDPARPRGAHAVRTHQASIGRMIHNGSVGDGGQRPPACVSGAEAEPAIGAAGVGYGVRHRSRHLSIRGLFVRRVNRGWSTSYKGDTTMRFMVIVKANKDSETGVLPDRKLLTEMGKFNEQ